MIQNAQDVKRLDWRTMGVLLVGAVCLALRVAIDRNEIPLRLPWRFSPDTDGALVAYLLIPMALLALLGSNPLRYFGLGRARQALPVFGMFGLILLAGSAWVSSLESVRATYGTRVAAAVASSPFRLLILMVCLEFFFRGFLLLPVFDTIGWYAVPLTTMPYCLIHVGKPLVELFGAIVFGLGLAYLAVRSQSILYGILLHSLVAMGLPFWVRVVP